MCCPSRPPRKTSFSSGASGPGASYLQLREQASRSCISAICTKQTSQASHSSERHCITHFEPSCCTFRRQKPFWSDSNALQPRSEPPLPVREFVRVQEETLGGMLCINILIGCEILGVPFALEAADNSRFWQAFSTQCAGFDVSIVALCITGDAHPKRVRLVRHFTSICSL